MRSIAGVGITPPKVLGTPKPASSVMISSTFGAPFGGTMRGAHQGLDCSAPCLITPPKAGSGAGSRVPGIVVVALGEPGVPVTCGACAAPVISAAAASHAVKQVIFFMAVACMAFPFASDIRRQAGRLRIGPLWY